MKALLHVLLMFSSFGLWAQQSPVNCNIAVSGCSTPSFAIVGTQPPHNTVDFTAGSISNPSWNPNSSPGNSGCLLSGETVSTFITINIVSSGTLQWSIIGSQGGCFDWIMWNISAGNGCAGINGNTLPPVACNWNGSCNGNTGMAAPGNLPPGGSQSSYENALNVTAGQSFMLCLSNYSFTNQNVNLNFFGSAQVVCGVSAADQTICLGNSASVTIATPGYTSPTFNWLVTTGVSNTSGGTNVTVTPAVTTTYSVVVTQAIPPLQDTATFTITVATPPAPNAGPDQTICLGSPINLSGTLGGASNTANWQAIVPTGLTPPATATFSPNFSSLNPTVTVNQPGVYKFVLRETSTICGVIRDTVQVTVSQLQIATAKTDPTCFGYADGSITITSVGATEYSFDNGVTWGASNTLSTFAAGTYTVCARNALGCQRCATVTLGNPPAVSLWVSNDTVVCQNGTATLSALASNGATFDYHWNHTPSLLPSINVSPVTSGYYAVRAESNLGCISPYDSIYVIVNPPINGQMSPDVYTCPGYPDSLMVVGTGGIGEPYTFTWSTGLVEVGGQSKLVASPTQTTLFTVTITDACESTPLELSGMIHVYELPVPQIAVDQSPKCEPAVFELVNTTLASMSSSTIWRLSNGDEFTNMDTVYNSPMMNGTYDVQLIVTSPEGCIDSTTFEDFLMVNKKPQADFNWSPNPVTMFNTEVRFAEFTANTDYFEWYFPGATPNTSSGADQTVMYPDGVSGTYHVTLIAHSNLGCSDTIVKDVVIVPEVIIYAPNAFTPDGDEFNQTWRVHMEGIDIYGFNLRVFNRWGELVWESMDPNASWDGTYNGKIAQKGTYTWVIEAKELISDKKHKWNGSMTIIR